MVVVLIIDACSASTDGRKQFAEFKAIVEGAFAPLLTMRTDFIIKKHSELDELLFDEEHSYLDLNAVKKFGSIDFIFITGRDSIVPWASTNSKLVIFLKMAMKTNKCVVGTGFAADLLTYMCATAGMDLRVKNISELDSAMPAVWEKHEGGHSEDQELVYLDEATGDAFKHAPKQGGWSSCLNIGLYDRHSIDKSGAVVRKRKATPSALKLASYRNNANEAFCRVRKVHIHHFLFKELKYNEFKISRSSRFNINEAINNTCGQRFTVLADTTEGFPLILEYSNLIMLQFQVADIYPETAALIKGYVKKKFFDMQEHNYVDQSCSALLISTKNQLAPSRGVDENLVISMGKETSSMVRPSRPLSASSKPVGKGTGTGSGSGGATGAAIHRKDSEATLPAREALPCSPRVIVGKVNKTAGAKDSSSMNNKSNTTRDASYNNVSPGGGGIFTGRGGIGEGSRRGEEHSSDVRRIKISRSPFCNFKKHQEVLKKETRENPPRSIINSSPYMSDFDMTVREHMDGKLKWMDRVGFNANTRMKSAKLEVPDVGVNASNPYMERIVYFSALQKNVMKANLQS